MNDLNALTFLGGLMMALGIFGFALSFSLSAIRRELTRIADVLEEAHK